MFFKPGTRGAKTAAMLANPAGRKKYNASITVFILRYYRPEVVNEELQGASR
jgi:hypothetical protein